MTFSRLTEKIVDTLLLYPLKDNIIVRFYVCPISVCMRDDIGTYMSLFLLDGGRLIDASAINLCFYAYTEGLSIYAGVYRTRASSTLNICTASEKRTILPIQSY